MLYTYGVPVSPYNDELVLVGEEVLAGVEPDDVAPLLHLLLPVLPVLKQKIPVILCWPG